MDWSTRQLKAKQLEKHLKSLSNIRLPATGWVKTIRETLGMNVRQLGQRCEVSGERISRIEADELNSKLTMATLEKVAKAMNCKFVYGFVPNGGIKDTIEKQAEFKAKSQLRRVSHSMALEDQKVSDSAMRNQIKILKEDMLQGNIKRIWEK
ncbi:MAG: DNA-binding protein [Rickettsiales bacterium]|nr:MAG: DNA-binding protein [Rickettsiales bacterium]